MVQWFKEESHDSEYQKILCLKAHSEDMGLMHFSDADSCISKDIDNFLIFRTAIACCRCVQCDQIGRYFGLWATF